MVQCCNSSSSAVFRRQRAHAEELATAVLKLWTSTGWQLPLLMKLAAQVDTLALIETMSAQLSNLLPRIQCQKCQSQLRPSGIVSTNRKASRQLE